ncbi:hypothetical protein [Micromonospora sp. CNB394]|uniref:hypothetical protein n=1 Tax=Micromonospora sp. CNB394 TaxID=1169151 RepID=UPI00035D671E|nr:hypothetical protein [Micromonospora sp. CNB394]
MTTADEPTEPTVPITPTAPAEATESVVEKARSSTQRASDVVLVAVPVAYVPHVARLLAGLDAESKPRPAPRGPLRPRTEPQATPWPVEELRRLSNGRSLTHRTVVRVLDALARRPGELLSGQELAGAAGTTREKLVGAFAGLTRLLKAHYDFPSLGMPFTRVPGGPEGRPPEMYYRIDDEQARRWRRARGHAAD